MCLCKFHDQAGTNNNPGKAQIQVPAGTGNMASERKQQTDRDNMASGGGGGVGTRNSAPEQTACILSLRLSQQNLCPLRPWAFPTCRPWQQFPAAALARAACWAARAWSWSANACTVHAYASARCTYTRTYTLRVYGGLHDGTIIFMCTHTVIYKHTPKIPNQIPNRRHPPASP